MKLKLPVIILATLLAAGVLALAVAPRVSAPSALAGNGTVSGVVTIGPTAPVCRDGEPFTGPGAGLTVEAADSNGQPAASTKTGTDGHYTLTLAPGIYKLTVKNSLYAKSDTITVTSGRTIMQDFALDTGIR